MLTLEEYETRGPSLEIRMGEISLVQRVFRSMGLRVTGKDQSIVECILNTDGGIRSGLPLLLLEDIAKACAIARAEGAQEERLRIMTMNLNASD